MLFPTSGFLLFFLVVAAAMMVLETRFAAKKAVLVLASYYFYAQWDWRFCFLLAFSSAVSYTAGRLIWANADRKPQQRARCGCLTDIERLRGPRHGLGQDADFSPDRLQLGDRQPFLGRHVRVRAVRSFGRGAKDRRDLLVVVTSLGHVASPRSAALPGPC